MAKTRPIREIVVVKSESAKISCRTAGLTASKAVQGQKIAMAGDIRARLNFLTRGWEPTSWAWATAPKAHADVVISGVHT